MKPKCVTRVKSELRQSETLLHMENSAHDDGGNRGKLRGGANVAVMA